MINQMTHLILLMFSITFILGILGFFLAVLMDLRVWAGYNVIKTTAQISVYVSEVGALGFLVTLFIGFFV